MKKEKSNIAENTGKVFMNLGQMVFGTLFLGGVLIGEVPYVIMIIAGFIGAGILIYTGLLLAAKRKE